MFCLRIFLCTVLQTDFKHILIWFIMFYLFDIKSSEIHRHFKPYSLYSISFFFPLRFNGSSSMSEDCRIASIAQEFSFFRLRQLIARLKYKVITCIFQQKACDSSKNTGTDCTYLNQISICLRRQ